jgi:hypothetical protein
MRFCGRRSHLEMGIWVCIQKLPDWVYNEICAYLWYYPLRSKTQRVMVAKLTRLTHKIAIQLHLVAESFTICSSRSRRPVRKLLDTPLYMCIKKWFKLVWEINCTCRVFFQKFMVDHLIKKFPLFMKPYGVLLCSRKPATGHYPEPGEYCADPHITKL